MTALGVEITQIGSASRFPCSHACTLPPAGAHRYPLCIPRVSERSEEVKFGRGTKNCTPSPLPGHLCIASYTCPLLIPLLACETLQAARCDPQASTCKISHALTQYLGDKRSSRGVSHLGVWQQLSLPSLLPWPSERHESLHMTVSEHLLHSTKESQAQAALWVQEWVMDWGTFSTLPLLPPSPFHICTHASYHP